MKNNLLLYFNTLSKDEVKRFRDFVNSPYFNSYKTIVSLFNYLKSKYPAIKSEHLRSYEISVHVYKQKRVNYPKVKKLTSDFTRILENFLIQKELEKSHSTNDLALLKSLKSTGYKDLYEKYLERIRFDGGIRKAFCRDGNDYLKEVMLSIEEYDYYVEDRKHNLEALLRDRSENLDYLFCFMKLHNLYEKIVLEYQKGAPLKLEMNYVQDNLEFVEKNRKKIKSDHPNIYIIYLTCRMHLQPGDNYAKQLISYIDENQVRFSKSQLSHYYRYLTSYYWLKCNEGETKYTKNIFDIYKMMVEKNIFVLDNYLTDFEFNNVVNAALPLGEHTWTEQFIEKHKRYLRTEEAKQSYDLAKAKVLFYQKEFDKVLLCLNGSKHNGSFYFINSKYLKARTFYELGDFDTASSTLALLDQYIKRKKDYLTNQQIKTVTTTNKYFHLLLRAKKVKSDPQFLLKELEKEKSFVSGRGWMMEKMKL